MSPPTVSSYSFLSSNDKKERVSGKEMLKHTVLIQNSKRNALPISGCGPHLALDLDFQGLRK